MTIQQYYQQAADVSLNSSIISAGMLSIILAAGLLFSWNLPLPVIMMPYLLLFFIHYNRYLLYRIRSEECSTPRHLYVDVEFFSKNNLLIAFVPAPAVRMLFFTPDGMMAGELKELEARKWRWVLPYFLDRRIPKEFGVYDNNGRLQLQMAYDGRTMKILDNQRAIIGFYYPKSAFNGTAVLSGGRKIYAQGLAGNNELVFVNMHGQPACRLQRGWMPLEWNRFFKDANTPVITFDYSSSITERAVIFAALANRYLYYNH